MPFKFEPIGICDFCRQPIKINWYTKRRTPRLHCCIVCRQTSNTLKGMEKRLEKVKARIAAGTWVNPSSGFTPEQRRRYAKLGSVAAGAKFKEEVAAGQWRNPALSTEARRKLSRPRTIKNKILHSAISKLTLGLKVADLTPQEAESHRVYRRNKSRALRASWTPEELDKQRAKWRVYANKYYHKRQASKET
jgi:hypothetical protein